MSALKRLAFIFSIISLFILTVYFSTELLLPFILGGFLGAVLEPGVSFLEKRGLSRKTAIVCMTILTLAIITLIFINFFPFVFNQIDLLRKQIPLIENRFQMWLNNLPLQKYSWFKKILAVAGEFIASAPAGILSQIPAILGNITGILWNIVLVPLIAFFILQDGWKIKKKLLEFVPNKYFEMAHFTFSTAESALAGFIRGIFMEILVDGTLAFLLLYIFGSVIPAGLAVVIGLFYIVPYIGPVIALSISIIANYFLPGGISPLKVIIAVGIVQIVDNLFVYPFVVGRETKLHPLIIIATLIISGKLMGFLGMVIGVPLVAMSRAIFVSLYRGLTDYNIV